MSFKLLKNMLKINFYITFEIIITTYRMPDF